MTVLEGERLKNDATGTVVLRFAPTAFAAGSFSLPAAAAAERVKVVAVGLVTGWAMLHRRRRLDEDVWQVTLSLLTPYAAHLLAERLHCSGVSVVESCGILLGAKLPMQLSLRHARTMPSTRHLCSGPVWGALLTWQNIERCNVIGLIAAWPSV